MNTEQIENVPTMVARLRVLSKAVTSLPESRSEFSMRVPAEPERDADLVLSRAADWIEAHAAELEDAKAKLAEKDARIAELYGTVRYWFEAHGAANARIATLESRIKELESGEPVNVWCDTCEGAGEIDTTLGSDARCGRVDEECPDCQGKGYWQKHLAPPAQPAAAQVPDDIRAQGWVVAVHNDYRLNGEAHTFWLLTKEGRCIKGEGKTDAEALNACRAAMLAPQREQSGESK